MERAIRARMLHAIVRCRIANSRRACTRIRDCSRYPFQAIQVSSFEGGKPLNQAELALTLIFFSAAPLLSLQKMGFNISMREKEDFVALRRHYGRFLGLSEGILEKCLMSFEHANASMRSMVVTALKPEIGGVSPHGSVVEILRAFSQNKRMLYFSFERSRVFTQQLVVSPMEEKLSLPDFYTDLLDNAYN